jgi:hypothetical protein
VKKNPAENGNKKFIGRVIDIKREGAEEIVPLQKIGISHSRQIYFQKRTPAVDRREYEAVQYRMTNLALLTTNKRDELL